MDKEVGEFHLLSQVGTWSPAAWTVCSLLLCYVFMNVVFTITGCSGEICCAFAHVCTQSYRDGSLRKPVEKSSICNQGNIMHLVLNIQRSVFLITVDCTNFGYQHFCCWVLYLLWL